ncbi:hypothetical protein OAG68_00445 [bacterium]|nr:hypothetical protein [bacterium]
MMSKRKFNIRHLFLLTLTIAGLITYSRLYSDDSAFVKGCEDLQGKPLGEFISYAKSNRRKIVAYENPSGGFGGADLFAIDGRLISLRVHPVHANNRPKADWNLSSFLDAKVVSINVYDLAAIDRFQINRFRINLFW